MAGFTNYSQLKPGDVFTVDGEHFVKIDALWFRSVENAPLGEQMMTAAVDAKINNKVDDSAPAQPIVDCSVKIINSDGEKVTPPSARKLATDSANGTQFKSKSEEKRVTALKKAKAAKTAKKAVKKSVKRKR